MPRRAKRASPTLTQSGPGAERRSGPIFFKRASVADYERAKVSRSGPRFRNGACLCGSHDTLAREASERGRLRTSQSFAIRSKVSERRPSLRIARYFGSGSERAWPARGGSSPATIKGGKTRPMPADWLRRFLRCEGVIKAVRSPIQVASVALPGFITRPATTRLQPAAVTSPSQSIVRSASLPACTRITAGSRNFGSLIRNFGSEQLNTSARPCRYRAPVRSARRSAIHRTVRR